MTTSCEQAFFRSHLNLWYILGKNFESRTIDLTQGLKGAVASMRTEKVCGYNRIINLSYSPLTLVVVVVAVVIVVVVVVNTSMVTRPKCFVDNTKAVKCQKISHLVVTFICYDNFCQRSHMARLIH
uniref:Uncharacterized protein n=1 Tax=Glossina austeni TaxID=7395 RepID=A0A1A9V693_GLOAU